MYQMKPEVFVREIKVVRSRLENLAAQQRMAQVVLGELNAAVHHVSEALRLCDEIRNVPHGTLGSSQ